MILADVAGAEFYFYVLVFTLTLLALFAGVIMFYNAWKNKDDYEMRKAKFIMLFAVIAMLCTAVVSFFETGKLPVN